MALQDDSGLLANETASTILGGRKYALVVGINDSSFSPIGQLKYAEDDAHEIYYTLRQSACNFKLPDSALTGPRAESDNIRKALVRLIADKADQDFLLFYYIGHAVPVRTKRNRTDIYFVTHNFDRKDVRVDPDMHLSMSWLRETLYETGSIGKVLIVLDCCYAGNIIEAGPQSNQIHINVDVDIRRLIEECLANRGINYQGDRLRGILTATRYNQSAQERDGHTLLSHLMLPALQGNVNDAMDQHGNINIHSLYMYLQSKMPEEQLPNLSGDFPRSCVLASYPNQSRKVQNDELRSEFAQLREDLKIITDPNFFKKHAVVGTMKPFDCTACEEASFAHLDLGRVNNFIAKEKVQVQKDFFPGLSDQEKLMHLGFLRENLPTYGTLLCLGNRSPDWVSGAFLRCFHWRGNDRNNGWKDEREFRGGLLEQFEAGRRFLGDCLLSSRAISKDGSVEIGDIPIRVLEEALANALVHREYVFSDSFKQRTDSVQVHVFDNRVEITSPGAPPYPMKLELLGVENEPHLRNPEIARIFYLNGYVEKAGSGVSRMRQLMKDADLPLPDFRLSGTETFVVTLYRPELPSNDVLVGLEESVSLAPVSLQSEVPNNATFNLVSSDTPSSNNRSKKNPALSPFYVKCVCPSCFEEIYLGDCRIVSGLTGKVLKDPSASWWTRQISRRNIEPLSSSVYVTERAHRECPVCSYLLPYNIERVPSITLSVVGDTFAGKSHYIASLIYQLRNDLLGNSEGNTRFVSLTPEIEKIYINECLDPLFTRGRALSLTQRATKVNMEPLIYELSVGISPTEISKSVNLMIYDTAGEDLEDSTRLVQFARYVLNTSAIIFVVDPLTMPKVVSSLPASLQAVFGSGSNITLRRDALHQFSNIMSILEAFHGRSSRAALNNLPIAVMVSKSDIFQLLNVPDSYTFMKHPAYGSKLDSADIIAVDQEVKQLLRMYGQSDLLAMARMFKHVQFFATSATGEPPDTTNRFQHVQPRRCLDPLLWILYELGIIEANM